MPAPLAAAESMDSAASSAPLASDPSDCEILMDPFKLWCQQRNLKDDVVAALIDDGFDKVETLGLMREEDIDAMIIHPKGQVRLLQAAVKQAREGIVPPCPSGQPTEHSTHGVTPPQPLPPIETAAQGFNIDALLSRLPTTVNAAMTPQPTQTFSRPEFDPAYHLSAGKSSSGNQKPLDIMDFIGLSCKVDNEFEQVVSEIGEGSSLILKTCNKKVKYESITVWQWALAAIRIQDELVRLGSLPSETARRQYMGYCCKILELNSRFEWLSILYYDKEYRGHQARFNFPWGTEIPHLSSIQLREKRPAFQPQSNRKNNKQSSQSRNSSSKNICRDYNKDKCTHVPCIYVHKCSVEGCGKSHPASQHDDTKN